jgi:uncharacterized protein (DUF2062 family)
MTREAVQVAPQTRRHPAVSALRTRVVETIVRQLRQGITPHKIALSIALGAVLGIFPILGSTTILCAAAASWLRLNQPIIQFVNYLVYPVQLAAILPFYRVSEALFGRPHLPLSLPDLAESFRADALKVIGEVGAAAAAGVATWCLVAPVMAAAIYYAVCPPLRRLLTAHQDATTMQSCATGRHPSAERAEPT